MRRTSSVGSHEKKDEANSIKCKKSDASYCEVGKNKNE